MFEIWTPGFTLKRRAKSWRRGATAPLALTHDASKRRDFETIGFILPKLKKNHIFGQLFYYVLLTETTLPYFMFDKVCKCLGHSRSEATCGPWVLQVVILGAKALHMDDQNCLRSSTRVVSLADLINKWPNIICNRRKTFSFGHKISGLTKPMRPLALQVLLNLNHQAAQIEKKAIDMLGSHRGFRTDPLDVNSAWSDRCHFQCILPMCCFALRRTGKDKEIDGYCI